MQVAESGAVRQWNESTTALERFSYRHVGTVVLVWSQMDLMLIAGVIVLSGAAITAMWAKKSGSPKAKQSVREFGNRRDEIIIDPKSVSEFKPTWRDS